MEYRGIKLYIRDTFILGGTISSNNTNKDELLISSLVERVKENIEEVILATSATIEGQTNAFYIQK